MSVDNTVYDHIKNMVENYDELIRKLIPDYDEMQEKVIGRLSFPTDKKIRVLDLGTGTGEVTKRILDKFPSCQIIANDLSPDMFEAAKLRLSKYLDQIEWVLGDMYSIQFPSEIDAVVSTLAIHHLTNNQKEGLYKRLFDCLKSGGVLSIGDLVTFRDPKKALQTEQEWKDHIFSNLGPEQGQYRFEEYKKGDTPAPLEDQIGWLKKAGFNNVSVDWELMNYSVFGGIKD